MKLTPLDLRQQHFRTGFRGYDRAQVVAFLAGVADDYEHALRETDRLQQDLKRMEALLNEHRAHERNLRNTLLTAQKLSDGIRENADRRRAGWCARRRAAVISCFRKLTRASTSCSARLTTSK